MAWRKIENPRCYNCKWAYITEDRTVGLEEGLEECMCPDVSEAIFEVEESELPHLYYIEDYLPRVCGHFNGERCPVCGDWMEKLVNRKEGMVCFCEEED